MRRAVFFQSRDGKLGGKQTADFKQISLIGCADMSLNDRVDSMERPRFHELLRLWYNSICTTQGRSRQRSTYTTTTEAYVFKVNYSYYEFELSVWLCV